MTLFNKTALLAMCLFFTACETTQPLYYWGDYENLVYEMYNKPGKAPPELQIDKLSQDVEEAESSGKKVAPGIHAHLGMMYAAVGNMAAAEAAFNNEKRLYPESATLLDGMLLRAYENKKKAGNTP